MSAFRACHALNSGQEKVMHPQWLWPVLACLLYVWLLVLLHEIDFQLNVYHPVHVIIYMLTAPSYAKGILLQKMSGVMLRRAREEDVSYFHWYAGGPTCRAQANSLMMACCAGHAH